jgi:hypothetical protein
VSGTTNVANPVQEVGLLTFPGLVSSSDAQYDYTNCGKSMQKSYISKYAAPGTFPPYFTIVGLSSDYKASDSSTTLNGGSSKVVDAVDWEDGNNCTSSQYGITDEGGVGTYYAGIINEAQADLSALSAPRSSVQNVIILLSDGNATSTQTDFVNGTSSTYYTNDCHQAIAAAATAAATKNAVGLKTWVYAVAYGSETSSSGYCTTDSPPISPCTTMTDIASDPTKFYSDDANGCVSTAHSTLTTLGQIFQNITYDFLTTRLLPPSWYNW